MNLQTAHQSFALLSPWDDALIGPNVTITTASVTFA
jgi:hypothetical protein